MVFCFWLTFDWDDELWDDGEDFGSTFFEHVECALDGKESVWVLLLANTFKEDWQVVMVV